VDNSSAMSGQTVRVAVVQHPPVLLHRDETLARGVELLAEAALPQERGWSASRRPGCRAIPSGSGGCAPEVTTR